MSMEIVNCEVFCYGEKEFEKDIMLWVSPFTAIKLKEIVDNELESKPKCFRMAVCKRVLNYKNKKDWFISVRELTPFEKEQEREELLAIWKLGIEAAKNYYLMYHETKHGGNCTGDVNCPNCENEERPKLLRAIDSWFFDRLTEFDSQLEKGEINEQKYIIRCNNMKSHKSQVEDLLSACVCSAIGRQNKAKIGGADTISDMFRIICMPCGFLG